MADPAHPDGALIFYGKRHTYFPPSVHQARSQCTMTAALMAANIACAGTLPATTQEAVELGKETGIPAPPPGGYTTDHMVEALRKRYRLDVRVESVSIDGWRVRLGAYGAGIIAVDYQSLPAPLRQLAPSFDGGHRLLIVGYDPIEDTTRLLDPLRPGGTDRGTNVKLRALYDAQGDFKTRQVWVREGQAVDIDAVFDGTWQDPRALTLTGDGRRTYRFWDRRRPGVPIEKTPAEDVTLEFDARASFRSSIRGLMPHGGPFLRISGGDRERLTGTWLEVTDDLSGDVDAGRPVPAAHKDSYAFGYLTGRAEERERWTAWLATAPEAPSIVDLSDPAPEQSIGAGLKARDDPD